MDIMGYVEEAADAVASAIKQVEEAAVGNGDAVLLEEFPRAVQLDGYSCGAQCVYMVLRYFGRSRAFKRLKRRLGTTRTCGTHEDAMVRVLRSEGLRARWRQRTPSSYPYAATQCVSSSTTAMTGRPASIDSRMSSSLGRSIRPRP